MDPTGTLFAERVTSREDFPEGSVNKKNISRLFPSDDSMVVIVDDKENVWADEGQTCVIVPIRFPRTAFRRFSVVKRFLWTLHRVVVIWLDKFCRCVRPACTAMLVSCFAHVFHTLNNDVIAKLIQREDA
jgi:hypothetical protein